MTQLTASQVYAYARGAGFSPSEAVVATAIAKAESGYRTDAVGDQRLADKTWGPSVGLWQVRSLNAERGRGTTRDATRLTDPAVNAQSAYAIYKSRGGWSDWSTYKDKAYAANLPEAQSVAGTPVNVGVALPTSSSSSVGGALSVTPASLFGNSTAADPVSWAGSITSGLSDGLTDAATGGLTALWQQIQPFLVTAGVASLGLALVGAGVLVTAWPTKTGA
jgi:hypothetical protein